MRDRFVQPDSSLLEQRRQGVAIRVVTVIVNVRTEKVYGCGAWFELSECLEQQVRAFDTIRFPRKPRRSWLDPV